jgi:hypothetical protein
MMEAEILKSLLESQDIHVWLRYEAAGTVIGLGVGPLARIDIAVRSTQAESARQILSQYYSGELEVDD